MVKARIRVGADSDEAYTVTMDPNDVAITSHQFPVKEWCIVDDMMNVSDSATFSIANDDGSNTDKFQIGQKITFDESDSDVAQGQWTRHLTGRIVGLDSYSDAHGGSNILVSAMDLGWHLTSSHGVPLTNLAGSTWERLLSKLTDSSWGFGQVIGTNKLSRFLKQGRAGITRSLVLQQNHLTSILPYIQVEPGQSPWDIISAYAQREGVLINVSGEGDLVFFRPDYTQEASYALHYHTTADHSDQNNILERPSIHEVIDGVYSAVEVFSTIVNPQKISNPEDPNAAYTRFLYQPTNPLPFSRLHVITDAESVTKQLLQNRAKWEFQKGLFDSWQYEADFKGHSQKDSQGRGHFFVSDTIISMNDSIHNIQGGYYVQRVTRSSTIEHGLRSKLLIKKTGLLNPELTKFDLGGGTKKSSQQKAPRK